VQFSQPISLGMGAELRRARADLIHLHAPNFWAVLMVHLFCPSTPLIVTHHADVEGRRAIKTMALPLYRALARRAACIIVTSRKNIAHSKDLPRTLGNVAVIPCGLDPQKYALDSTDHAAARELKQRLFGNKFVLGFVGRFTWYKGLSVLLQALVRVPDVSLLLVGGGPCEQEILAQAEALGVRGRVHFAGKVSHRDKIILMHSMDAVTLPSTHVTETFGISQVEAQLCGRPVITTNLPTGVSDVTVDGVTGLVVQAGDVDALTQAISRMAENATFTKKLGQCGRERALAEYSEETYARKLCTEIDRLFHETSCIQHKPVVGMNRF
jgi:rhamnosyl/mannosyltransferase